MAIDIKFASDILLYNVRKEINQIEKRAIYEWVQ